MAEKVTLNFNKAATSVKNMASAIHTESWQYIKDAYVKMGDLQEYWKGKNYNDMADTLNRLGSNLWDLYEAILHNSCQGLYNTIKAYADSDQYEIIQFSTSSPGKLTELQNTEEDEIVFDLDEVSSMNEDIAKDLKDASDGMEEVKNTYVAELNDGWVGDNASKTIKELEKTLGKIQDNLKDLADDLNGAIESQIDIINTNELKNKAKDFISETGDKIQYGFSNGVTKVKNTYDSVKESVHTTWNSAMDGIEGLIDGLKFDED